MTSLLVLGVCVPRLMSAPPELFQSGFNSNPEIMILDLCEFNQSLADPVKSRLVGGDSVATCSPPCRL